MSLTKVSYSMITGAPVNVADFGATSGVNSTTQIQAAIDSMSAGDMLYFPAGNWLFDVVDFDVADGKIGGSGIIKGTLNITTGADRFVIDGLTFDASSVSAVDRGITLEDVTIGTITNCIFKNLETAIYVDTTAAGQVSRVTVTENQYTGCAYFIATSVVTSETFGVADWIVANNSGNASIDHVFMNTYDGVTIHDNVFFGSANPAYTRNCVRLVFGTWTDIHDNKFFESGSESIYIDQITNVSIHDNTHAYSGQYIQTNAINIKGTPTTGGTGFTNGSIHDEIIIEPSGSGIALDASQNLIQIHNNYIYKPGANSRYFGPTPLTGVTIGISINSSATYISTNNNVTVTGTNTLPQGTSAQLNTHTNNITVNSSTVQNQTIEKFLTLTGAETSIDVARWDYIALQQSGATNVSSIVNSEGEKTISLRFYNGNSTLVNGANLLLKGGVNVTPAANNVVTFIVYSSSAVEIARNF
jgi:hypothetical protein